MAASFLEELPRVNGGFKRSEVWRDAADGDLQYGEYEANKDPRETFGRVTCHDCNGVWMGDLEGAAKRHVIDLADGGPVSLSAVSQGHVSAWVGAAGVVRGKLEKPPHFVDDDGQRMPIEGLPEGFKVWIVLGVRRDDIPTRHSRVLTTSGPSWLSWLWIGHTIFVVASPGVAELLALNLMAISPHVRQIHPIQDQSVEWPPLPLSSTEPIGYEQFVDLTTLR